MIMTTTHRPLTLLIHNDGWGLSKDQTDTLRWAKRYVLLAPIQGPDGSADSVEVILTTLQAMTMVQSGWMLRRSGSLATPTAYIWASK